MKATYYVIECPSGVYITDGEPFMPGDVVVCEGSWQQCSDFICPPALPKQEERL
jgi:hypothetical protein